MDVENFVKQCDVCQHVKHERTHPAGLLQPLPIPDGAWRDITIDFIEDLPKSEGYNYIIVVVYKFFDSCTVLEPIGDVAYHLDIPPASQIHPVFHISQLKEYHQDYSPMFSELPVQVNFSKEMLQPDLILECRLVQKGNATIPQVRVKWL
jgi:hypothetical protein